MFSQQAEHELLQTVRAFHVSKHKEGQSVSSYVLKMKSCIESMERLAHPMSLNLATLPKKDVAYALHAIQTGRIQKNNHKNKKPQMSAKGNNQGKGKTKLAYVPAYVLKP
ncbi:hypothetical protein Tco_1504735 [Tanacetum coccineum]